MLSFKRLMYIVVAVAALGCAFLAYGIVSGQSTGSFSSGGNASGREYFEAGKVAGGDKPKVWVLGDAEDARPGSIRDNVGLFCEDAHLGASDSKRLDVDAVGEQDVVVLCDASVDKYAEPDELERFVAEGGRLVLAAGLEEGGADSSMWPMLGIRDKGARTGCEEFEFEGPLLPVQPQKARYGGSSDSVSIEVVDEASVYVRDAESGIPVVYTHEWREGEVCIINGTFLEDVRCMGLLTGAIAAMLPDFIYPVLGVKAVFLDDFPSAGASCDELCQRLYGYSAEGFVREEVWGSFQGLSLRTETPLTSSVVAVSSSRQGFEDANDALFLSIGKSVLQFGGELAYASDCSESTRVVFDQELIDRVSATFADYSFEGLALETDVFSSKMTEVPGADIRFVRGMLEDGEARLSYRDGLTVFPAATEGGSMDDGNLLAICSVLGSYGMVSHVFDVEGLIATDDGAAAWDSSKEQIGLLESEVLSRATWLEGRTLSQTEDDVKSYTGLDYGWTKNGNRVELDCKGAAVGQPFLYHADARVVDAKGLAYQDVGNGYYLLRIQEGHAEITLEERG